MLYKINNKDGYCGIYVSIVEADSKEEAYNLFLLYHVEHNRKIKFTLENVQEIIPKTVWDLYHIC